MKLLSKSVKDILLWKQQIPEAFQVTSAHRPLAHHIHQLEYFQGTDSTSEDTFDITQQSTKFTINISIYSQWVMQSTYL